jgi:hypothetical protein
LQDLGLAGELLEMSSVKELGQGVVRTVPSFGELTHLDEHRSTDQLGISSAVVEMQVAVGDMSDVVKIGTGGGQGRAAQSPDQYPL